MNIRNMKIREILLCGILTIVAGMYMIDALVMLMTQTGLGLIPLDHNYFGIGSTNMVGILMGLGLIYIVCAYTVLIKSVESYVRWFITAINVVSLFMYPAGTIVALVIFFLTWADKLDNTW